MTSLDDNAITYTKKSSSTLATVKGLNDKSGLKISGSTTKKSWTLKNSTATYKQTTTAGYSLDDNAITYTKKSSSTLATVKGLNDKSGLKVSGSTTKKSWTLENSTATYKQTTTAGYSIIENEIIYSKKSSKTLATVKGLNDKSGLKVSGSTVKLAGDALSKKVTVSGAYTFDFDSDFKNATITGSSSDDTILARGKNIFVTGGDGSIIIEDFDDSLDKIRVLSGDVNPPTVDKAGDVTFAVDDGQIVIKGGASKYIPICDEGKNILMKHTPR